MGPKKKGKGSKLARMSEEERVRYMQHRAAIEEEARRRKEQLIANYMKNKLKHEEAFMRLNSAKINQQWRHILRQVKCKELNDNMKFLWTTFEAAVIAKNKIIQALLSDLEEAEVQYSMMLENHVQVVNRFIGLHQDRLKALHKTYSKEKGEVLDAACRERASTATESEFACEFLQTVTFDMDTRNSRKHHAGTSNAAAKQDELRNQMQSEIEKVEEQGGLHIEGVWHEIQQVLKDYMTDTAPNRPHYNSLKAKDKTNTEQLLYHCDLVNKYTDMIADLKHQLGTMQRTQALRVKELKEEQSAYMGEFNKLKQAVSRDQARDDAQLTTLSVTSSDVIKDLTRLAQKGEAILQISSTCQKFLTENEKLRNYNAALTKRKEGQSNEEEEQEGVYKEMDNFWQQHNEVVLECEQLGGTRDTLAEENRQLRRLLKQYLNTLVRPTSVPRALA